MRSAGRVPNSPARLESAKHLPDWPNPGPTVRHHLLITSDPSLALVAAQLSSAADLGRWPIRLTSCEHCPGDPCCFIGERNRDELERASLEKTDRPVCGAGPA